MLIPHDRGTVDVFGDRPAKTLIQQIVFRCRCQIFISANHMGNAHKVIIDDIGKVIGGKPIPFQQDLIVQFAVIHGDFSKDLINKGGAPFRRDPLADDIRLTGSRSGIGFFP